MNNNMQFRICPNCGRQVNVAHPSCWSCGMALYQQPMPQMYYQQQYQFQQFHNKNIKVLDIIGMVVSLIGFVMSIIAVFLPYISIDVFGYSQKASVVETTNDTYIILGLCAIGIIVVACRCKTYGIDTMLISVILIFITFFHINNIKTKLDEIEYSGFVKIGSGIYLLLISGIIILIGGIILCVAHSKKNKG